MANETWVQVDPGLNSGSFIVDAQTRAALVLSRSSSYVFRYGVFEHGVIRDMEDIASLRLLIRPSQTDDDSALVDKTVSSGLTEVVSASAWINQNAYHGTISVTAAEMDLDLLGEESAEFWMVIEATFDDASTEVLGAATFTVTESNVSSTPSGVYMTKAVYDTNDNGQCDNADSADAVDWSGVANAPGVFAGAGDDGLVPDPSSETGKYLKDDGTWSTPSGTFSPATFAGNGVPGYVPDPGSETGKYLEDDGTWSTPSGESVFAGSGADGLVPDPTSETGKYLEDDGTWSTPTNTTYSDFAGLGASGLVPDPGAEADKYLKDDGTWDYPVPSGLFAGATTTGGVPDPGTENNYFLRDDGTWVLPTDTDTTYSDFAGAGGSGLVPDPTTATGKYLEDDGTWSTPANTTYSDFAGAGASGLVPDPTTATGKYLEDDGTWSTPTDTDTIPTLSKVWTIENPSASEDVYLFFTPVAITITKQVSVHRGTTPSVTLKVKHSTDRSAAGNSLITTPSASTSTTTGDVVTSFDDATIPANSHVWLETTAMSGTVDETGLTLIYTED